VAKGDPESSSSTRNSAADGSAPAAWAPTLPPDLHKGYVEFDHVRMYYVEAGDGPLVVLLHRFPEFWFAWRLQIAPLAAAGFRVVAPDTRGYNLSSKPEGFEAFGVDRLGRHPRPDRRTRRSIRAVGRSRLGWNDRLDHRDEPTPMWSSDLPS
jgi:pimeloyl-ACP methyl ester carboxylesterase